MNGFPRSRFFISWFYLVLFICSQQAFAGLSQTTARVIEGTPPHLSSTLEANIDDLDLFGLKIDNHNYYGDEINQSPITSNYPFKNKIQLAPIKQPNDQEYFDADGDELLSLTESPYLIDMTWYYTDVDGNQVEFTPSDTDTFCNLAKQDIHAPFKIKLSTDFLTLFSKYGTPDYYQYPNADITTKPSKTYTIMHDVGICYAKPEINPPESGINAQGQWDATYGFLPQSRTEASKNFPSTGFYGARFQLILSNPEMAKDYEWSIKQGGELVQVNKDPTTQVITVSFDTPDARDPAKAWQYIMGSTDGHTVIVEGKNPQKNTTIKYSFTLVKWFVGWDESNIGKPQASIGSAQDVVNGCNSLAGGGKYRISYSQEVVNSNLMSNKTYYTREIGTLFSEWGDPSQKAYPNSWAPAENQNNKTRRIWLYDPDKDDFCDLHTYDAKYHCVNEANAKNGLCTSIR